MSDLSTVEGLVERRDEVQIVDVREQDEWDAGYVEGSVHIPLNALLAGTDEGIVPGKPIVAVCRSGQRSEVAALMLRARGHDAHNLEGGLEAWQTQGLPLTTPQGAEGRVA